MSGGDTYDGNVSSVEYVEEAEPAFAKDGCYFLLIHISLLMENKGECNVGPQSFY